MKKIFVLLLALVTIVACGRKEKADTNTLYLFNWSDYLPEEILNDFERETGIKVIADYYSSNEEMYAKIKAGSTGYDIIFPSTDFAEIMLSQGMLEKIDLTKVPNLANLNESISSKIDFDKGHNYVIPYAVGATGIAVNKKYVTDYTRDFSIFTNEKYKNRMTLLDDMREVLTSALVYNGFDSVSTDEKELEIAKNTIKEWKKNILKFDSESFGKGFANEEYWIVHGYYENIVAQIPEELYDNVEFFIPEKGGTMYIDSMVILKGSKNLENAHTFINYIHKPEVYVKVIDYLETPSINIEAEKIRETIPAYTIEDLEKTVLLRDLGEALEVHNKTWTEAVVE